MHTYCHLCGHAYGPENARPQICPSCGNHYFENASPATEIALFNEKGEVLISERGIDPNKGCLDLPGGFLELNESLEDGLVREVREELGLETDDYTTPIYILSMPETYTYSNETRPTLMTVFASKLKTDKTITADDDVASVQFISMEELDSDMTKEMKFSLPQYPDIIKRAHKALFG